MDIMDINKVSEEIGDIKYPVIFLFSLIPHINSFDDQTLSIVLRLFLKHHHQIAMNYNLKYLFQNELNNKYISSNVLNDFYKLIGKKISLIMVLKKWYEVYENKEFWKLNILDQNEYLLNVKNRFLSIYDCAKGGVPFCNKIIMWFRDPKINKNIIMETIIDRLEIIVKIFGTKLFESLEIPLITITEFYQLSNENIIKYMIVIWEKFNELLNQTIKLFDSYNLVCIQLDNLINPILLKINDTNIESDTELDDIKLISY